MKPLHAWTSDHFEVPLPAGHPFPMAKYRALRELLVAEGVLALHELHACEPAPRAWRTAAHDPGEGYCLFNDVAVAIVLLRAEGHALATHGPDVVFYHAGVDAHQHDCLGRLAMTHAGLAERDARVFAACEARRRRGSIPWYPPERSP